MKQPADSSSGGADTGPLLPPMIEGLEVEGDGEPPPSPPFEFEDIMPEGMAEALSHLSLQAPGGVPETTPQLPLGLFAPRVQGGPHVAMAAARVHSQLQSQNEVICGPLLSVT